MFLEVGTLLTRQRVERVECQVLTELFVFTHLRFEMRLKLNSYRNRRSFDSPSSLKCFAERDQSRSNSCLDRAQRLPGLAGNLGVSHAFEISHFQRAALCCRHLAQHAANFFGRT